MQLQGMHPEMAQGPHMTPRSIPLQRPTHQMPPHGMGMMGTSNPYGPSGPLPPNMGGQMMQVPMRPNVNPVGQKVPNPLNNVQLQQLSAQIKAYRLLSRNMVLPDALISIVQGRKPTAAMLGALNRGNTAGQQSGMGGYQLSGGVPSPAGSSAGTGRESPAQTNISLYPPSPSNLGPGAADGSGPPASHLTQSHTSSAAPNVTLQPGGELPPQVHVYIHLYMHGGSLSLLLPI